MFKFKWLSPDGDGTGGAASGTPTPQNNAGGNGGQSAPDPRIKELSDENASWRNKHKQAADEAAKWKTELDAANAKLLASEAQYGVERALFSAAARAKFNDPADALKYVDMAAIMKLDADKRDAAITEAVNKVATEKAYLVQAAPEAGAGTKKPGASTSTANPAETKPTLTIEMIKAMSEAEINANWNEVQAALRAGK